MSRITSGRRLSFSPGASLSLGLFTLLLAGCASEDPGPTEQSGGSGAFAGSSGAAGTAGAPIAGSDGLAGAAGAPAAGSGAAGSDSGLAGAATAGESGAPMAGADGLAGAAGMATMEPEVSFYEFSYQLVVTCGFSICHLPNYENPDFSNRDGDLYQILMTWTVPQCNDAPLVVPGDPAASAIIQLATHQCGDFVMPTFCDKTTTEPCIFPDELEVFTSWIQSGALPD